MSKLVNNHITQTALGERAQDHFRYSSHFTIPLYQSYAGNGRSDVQQSFDQSHCIARICREAIAERTWVVGAKAKNSIVEFSMSRDAMVKWYRWIDNDRIVH